MINNVSVIEHDKLILYSLDDFSKDKDLQNCIWNAKIEAISQKNASCQVQEIGNGSANNTTVFCIPNPDIPGENLALKIVSYVTTTYPPEQDADDAIRDLVNNMPKKNRVIDEIINGLKTQDCRNVIPLSGHDTIIWKCPKYNRVGIDYALKMPLADCISNTIPKYVTRHSVATGTSQTEEKPSDEKLILQLGLDLCIALQDLHAHGIIHRDIKPGNIFWYKGHYCLGDFGIAIENPNSQDFKVGTQEYWAPEQTGLVFSDKYDHRMDIYSLGLVLYELADTMPISAHYTDRMKGQYLSDLSSVSKGLNKILHKACQFDPDDRYQSAEAFWTDLHLLQKKHDYIPVYHTPQESPEYVTSKSKRAGIPNNTAYSSGQKGTPYGRKQARKMSEDFIFSPEMVWNAGKFWYEESCKEGNRFAGLDIDRRIMPLSFTSNHVIDLPVHVFAEQETVENQRPLSEIISNTEKIHNMYLIGEGGIGKTTALYSIMKDTYRQKLPSKSENRKQIIPLFIELSKAPTEYCRAYESSQSTFIRRYLFMLINSFHSQHLISESAVEMTRIMQMDMISSVQKIDEFLRKTPNNVQYLLLLDGLNEVSRKQLSTSDNDYMGSPLEFIVGEIHELLKHPNVSVIITSRADETLGDSENVFNRLYLTGVSKRAIKKYLTQHEISFKRIKENERLIETLRIPLFLKLYSQLYVTSEVSTPGEILYAFFSERSAKYTIRNRISEIKADHRMSGENPASNLIDEKLQWFILDFLLPELGWYMEKNDLYTVNLETIKQVVDSILKGTSETDICGIYGKAMFRDYHNGKDGSINTQTYAEQLLHLNRSKQSYVQTIVDYCVYSFGILYVNNQNYGFIHQHIRDFFAALKIITDIKFASAVLHTDKTTAIDRLSELNNNILSVSVSQFLSDLSVPLSSKNKYDFYSNALNICRNTFDVNIGIAVKNIVEILYKVRGSLADMDFTDLDLRKCQLYGIDLERSSFGGAKLSKNTLFFKGHNGNIRSSGFSPDGKHLFSIESDDTLRIWNTHALAEENNVSKESVMRPIVAKYSVSGKLFFIVYFMAGVPRNYVINVYDSRSMKCMKQKKVLCTLHNGKTDIIGKQYHFNFVEISPDDKYLIIGDIFNTILLDPIQRDENNKRFIHSFKRNLNQVLQMLTYLMKKPFLFSDDLDLCPQISADPLKQYIVVAFPYNANIIFYSANTLKEEFRILLPDKKYFSKHLCFCPTGQFLAVFMASNIYILDIKKRVIFRTRIWNRNTGRLRPTSCQFLNFNSETCMILKYETGKNGANPYQFGTDREQNIIVWSFTSNTDILQMTDTKYNEIYGCFEDFILFESPSGLQLTNKLNKDSGVFLFNKKQYVSSNIENAVYSSNKAYLVIYSETCIQIWDSVNLHLIHEMYFCETIQSVLCSSRKLYIAFSNGYFRVFELNTWNLLYENTNFRNKQFFLSPKQNFLIVQNYEGDFELYDIHSFEYIRSFDGDFFAFNYSETQIIVGHNYTKYGEEKTTDHIILTEWKLNVTTGSDKYNYTFEIVNMITEDIIIKFLRAKGFNIGNVTYFFVVDLTYLPESNKLIIYFKLTYSTRYIFSLWNMDTKKCEKLISSEDFHGFSGFSEMNGNFYAFRKDNNSIMLINLHTLKKRKVANLTHTYNIEEVKAVQKNLLQLNPTSIEICNIQTGKYFTLPFLPNLYVKDAIFTATSTSQDFDDSSLKVLEMYGGKLE